MHSAGASFNDPLPPNMGGASGVAGAAAPCAFAFAPQLPPDEIWKLWSAPKAKTAHMSNKTVIWSIP